MLPAKGTPNATRDKTYKRNLLQRTRAEQTKKNNSVIKKLKYSQVTPKCTLIPVTKQVSDIEKDCVQRAYSFFEEERKLYQRHRFSPDGSYFHRSTARTAAAFGRSRWTINRLLSKDYKKKERKKRRMLLDEPWIVQEVRQWVAEANKSGGITTRKILEKLRKRMRKIFTPSDDGPSLRLAQLQKRRGTVSHSTLKRFLKANHFKWKSRKGRCRSIVRESKRIVVWSHNYTRDIKR